MSGGVDSTVAAALLHEQGYEVIGLWMQVLGEDLSEETPSFRDALSSAQSIGIPLFPVDLRESFQEEVIDYFLQEYLAGRTPNPCVLCNPRIKFGPLMERGLELCAELFATGHYARTRWDSEKKRFCLLICKQRTDPFAYKGRRIGHYTDNCDCAQCSGNIPDCDTCCNRHNRCARSYRVLHTFQHLNHHLRLDAENDSLNLRGKFRVTRCSGNSISVGEKLKPFSSDIADQYVLWHINLGCYDTLYQGLSHITAADKADCLHFFLLAKMKLTFYILAIVLLR